MNEQFKKYFKETFFQEKDAEFQDFLRALTKPLPRSIRIIPGQEASVKKRLTYDGWKLFPTNIERVYTIDRQEDFNPYERRIGMTFDSLIGNFYIQELAAAHSVPILTNHTIHTERFLVLDMASSPGGKTTQLAEYFPNSFIIANEPTRARIPQLLQNLERMPTANVGVTLYPGQWWKNFPEIFDRILLDAPCSGEGTLYKGTNAAKNWHIKNIHVITRLQKKLFESALHALKVGGEMVYSTCSLNMEENEGVLAQMQKQYRHTFTVCFEKKFWPHSEHTGGFFIVKIQKIASLPPLKKKEVLGKNNTFIQKISKNFKNWTLADKKELFRYKEKVLALKNSDCVAPFLPSLFFMRFGEEIGTYEGTTFSPNARAFRSILPEQYEPLAIKNTEELDSYFRGGNLLSPGKDGFVLLSFDGIPFALEQRIDSSCSNSFPKAWRRV